MSNFPEGNPNTYLFIRPGIEFQYEVAAAGPGGLIQMFITKPGQPALSPEGQAVGCEASGAAFILNSKLQGATVLVNGKQHIDHLADIFSQAESQALFAVKNLTDGWDEAMVASFNEIEVGQGGSSSSELVEAVRTAHERMIPF